VWLFFHLICMISFCIVMQSQYNLCSVWFYFHLIYMISFCIVMQSQYNLCSVWFYFRLVYMITFCYAIQSKYNLPSVCTFTFTLFSQTRICLFTWIFQSKIICSFDLELINCTPSLKSLNVYKQTWLSEWCLMPSEQFLSYSTLQVYQRSYSQVRHIPSKMSDKFESQHSLSPTIWSDILVGRESGY
jgi:hypothetical protein